MVGDRLVTQINKKLACLTRIDEDCCMYKVHELLRDVNEKAYKPTLLAIGPFHRGNVGQGFMEEHKLRYLQQMLERKKESVELYIEALRELAETACKCYAEDIDVWTQDEFVEMMLLDGCFIIELFRKYEFYYQAGDFQGDPIFQMNWIRRIARDLLLFENQLPFFVLAKLLEMIESNETLHRSRFRNLRERVVDIDEEKDGIINVESSTSTAMIIQTRLSDLALSFFSYFLPFKWNVNASSYNSIEKIKHLLFLAREADLTHSLPHLVCKRLMVGFRFKNVEFKHLLDLVHTSICLSVLDTEIVHAREAEVRLKNARIFKHLFGLMKAICYGGEFQNPESKVTMAETEDVESILVGAAENIGDSISMEKLYTRMGAAETGGSISIQVEPKFQEAAGVELLDMAMKFIDEYKIINNYWTEIPFAFEPQEAGIKFDKAEKFKRLLAPREIEQCNIHGAKELEEAGIKFEKSKRRKVLSIKFNNGLMEISPLSIDDNTETYLRNLIAYEQYCDRDNGYFNYVTNYVRFMDRLINSPKDVELLCREGIIHNYLGDDVVISTMVNKLCHNINFSTTNSINYVTTSMDVDRHCRRKMNMWVAILRRDYFSSPWALISFLAAVFLLGLTIVQTVFSIIP